MCVKLSVSVQKLDWNFFCMAALSSLGSGKRFVLMSSGEISTAFGKRDFNLLKNVEKVQALHVW